MSAQKSRSLYGDAWRRLLRNRMAVVCGAIVLIQVLLVTLSFLIAPFDPDHQELWIQMQPPGFTHPDVEREMLLTVGSPAGLPARSAVAAEATGILILSNVASERSELRVTISGGVIATILKNGREPVDSVIVGGTDHPESFLRVIPEQGAAGVELLDAQLVTGAAIPEWLARPGAPNRWVAIVELVTAKAVPFEVKTKDGIVTMLREDGKEVSELHLEGRNVVKVLSGDREITHTHWLGTDSSGRDLWSRILWGGWVSLAVGIVATLVSLAIGVVYGAASAFFGGKVDTFMMAVVDILYAVPYMFMVILLLVMFGRNIIMLFIALGCVEWLTMARIVRGQALSLKEKEFVEAARTTGARDGSIIFRHLIPNTLGIVVVYTTLTIPAVILQEAFLAFIGLNVEYGGKAIESWGALVNTGRLALGQDGQNWWLLVFPAMALAVMLFCLNFLGDGLRDAFDPKMKGKQ